MKIAVFVSGGGHLDEALSALESIEGHEWLLFTYNLKNLREFKHPLFEKVYFLSFFSSRSLMLYASLAAGFFQCLWIFLHERPQVLISTGSEIAILPFYLGKFLFGTRNIFLETVTRFQVPSATARVIYPASDFFLVQWKDLLKHFGPKAKYAGRIL